MMRLKDYVNPLKWENPILRTCAGILVVAVSMYIVYRIALSPSDIKWVTGDAQTYSFKMTSSVRTIDFKTGLPNNYNSEITGKLNFKIFDIKNDIVNAGFHLETESATVNNQPVDSIKKLYSYPFYVNFSTSGKPLQIYTSKEVSKDDEKFIKGLLYYLQYIYPLSAVNWKIDEEDINGKYISNYSSGWSEVVKSRKVSPRNSVKFNPEGKSVVTSSSFRYTFDDKWSWIYSLKAVEKWKTSRSDVSANSVIEIELIADGKELSSTSLLRGDNMDYAEIVSELETTFRKTDSIWEEMRLEKASKSLRSDSYLELIALFNKKQLTPAEFISKMTDYLKIHKNGAFILADKIRGRGLNDRTGDLIMYSMGNAGTLECQKALFSIASAASLTYTNRTRAAVYLGDLRNPDTSTIQMMKYFSSDYSQKNSAMLSSAMICSLGRLSSLAGDETYSKDINNHIHQKLANDSAGLSEKCSLLNAASNTGNEEFISDINRELKNTHSFVRLTAINAMENMEGEEADRAIRDTMRNDTDPMVRKQAVKVQENRGYDEQFTKELFSLYDGEKESEVRLNMVSYLRSVKGNNKNVVPFMESVLKNETDPDVRIMLLKAINTSR